MAVQALQGFHQVPWPFSYALRQCRLWLGSFDIHHVFREETKLQIGWQPRAYSHQDMMIYSHLHLLPREVQKTLFFDEGGLLSFRN